MMRSFFDSCAQAKREIQDRLLAAVHLVISPPDHGITGSQPLGQDVLNAIIEKLNNEPLVILSRQVDEFSFDALIQIRDLTDLKRALSYFQESLLVSGIIIEPQLRFGICLYEDSFTSYQTFHYARTCCYEISNHSESYIEIFDSEAEQLRLEKKQQQQMILKAISDEQIILFLQPKINLQTSEIIGLEALARWRLADGTIQPPTTFLPYIEGTELELVLGFLVVKQAISILSEFKQLGIKIPLNINVSPRQLSDRNFAQFLVSSLKQHAISPHMLGVEVLENEGFLQLEHTKKVFDIYRSARIDISLDDFGTGYASLNHLVELPIREVKIDRVFVKNLSSDSIYQSIIRGVVELAQELNLTVTAEGIETQQQHELVRALGVNYAQGFLYQRPMSVDAFLAKFTKVKDGVYFVNW